MTCSLPTLNKLLKKWLLRFKLLNPVFLSTNWATMPMFVRKIFIFIKLPFLQNCIKIINAIFVESLEGIIFWSIALFALVLNIVLDEFRLIFWRLFGRFFFTSFKWTAGCCLLSLVPFPPVQASQFAKILETVIVIRWVRLTSKLNKSESFQKKR